MRTLVVTLFLWLGLTCAAQAQPVGWSDTQPIYIASQADALPAGYQLRIELDTAALIATGDLQADGGDLRFGATPSGATFLDYFIASGINTATTVVFVRTPAVPANSLGMIYMFYGNPAAADASTATTFDYVSLAENTTLGQGPRGAPSGSTNSQRGHRFIPTEDLLVTDLGGNVPTASTRPITLFDFDTQTILRQESVALPSGAYAYAPIDPILLEAGETYLLTVFNAAGQDDYWFGSTPVPVAEFGYQDMRYCNGCSANTFPTSVLGGLYYGLPDFVFRTRVQLASPPTYSFAPPAVPLGRDLIMSMTLGLLLVGAGMAIRRRWTADTQ